MVSFPQDAAVLEYGQALHQRCQHCCMIFMMQHDCVMFMMHDCVMQQGRSRVIPSLLGLVQVIMDWFGSVQIPAALPTPSAREEASTPECCR